MTLYYPPWSLGSGSETYTSQIRQTNSRLCLYIEHNKKNHLTVGNVNEQAELAIKILTFKKNTQK